VKKEDDSQESDADTNQKVVCTRRARLSSLSHGNHVIWILDSYRFSERSYPQIISGARLCMRDSVGL
jgi:hypothetical protein